MLGLVNSGGISGVCPEQLMVFRCNCTGVRRTRKTARAAMGNYKPRSSYPVVVDAIIRIRDYGRDCMKITALLILPQTITYKKYIERSFVFIN